MTSAQAGGTLPLRGVVGIVDGDSGDPASLREVVRARRLGGLELRADLLAHPDDALAFVEALRGETGLLVTLRREADGGKFDGDDGWRIAFYRRALAAGADLVDAEWGSEAATLLAKERAPLVVSWHDFSAMPSREELDELTRDLLALAPRALKIVPTARVPLDGARMLEWVAAHGKDEPPRVGFAMGEAGIPSRLLSIAWGAPFTYAPLGGAVAPGQVSLAEMLELYRVDRLSRATRVYGVAGNPVSHSLSPHMHNPAFARRSLDAVYLPFWAARFDDVLALVGPLGIHGLSVTIPYKGDAFVHAGERADERSRSAQAANTLLFERGADGTPSVRAFNTDFDGVLEPLRRRGLELQGLEVAVLGNGGAARGAARALEEAGANVTLYYRNPRRGGPVAGELGIRGRELSELAGSGARLVINATSQGLNPGDPSPVTPDVFDATTLAFEMVYEPERTAFTEAARAAGAEVIPGREMLVSQGLVQFGLFTGTRATYEEFEEAFLRGLELRRDA